VLAASLIPWLDPTNLIEGFGAFALLGVCVIVFAETGLLVGFLFPGDTLLIISGLLAFPPTDGAAPVMNFPIWLICLAIGFAAFVGGEAGYLIGHKAGPRVFERKESGFFSIENVKRTNHFFERFGGLAVIVARFVPIVRTFAPVAAGVGHMHLRKYTIYNLIGAMLWGGGLTFGGYLLGYIPAVADLVTKYIDVILLGAVLVALVPTVYHYIRSSLKARRIRKAGVKSEVAESELVLGEDIFARDKLRKSERQVDR
jgi:membrane-associated protein